MHKLVLLRHGQSTWNLENRFTGWFDCDLSEQGVREATDGGRLLKEEGYEFDIAFTSVLLRANRTLEIALKEMGQSEIPITYSWKLNERHYGALQGLNKAETTEKHGADQVKIWRRSYDVPPPELARDDERHPGNDEKYKDLRDKELPATECLKDTVARVVPYWTEEIVPKIQEGKRVIVAAHGNSLRALVMYLDNISESDILELNIPTGVPLVYELDDDLKPIKNYYLGDPEAIKKAQEAVANQGKKQ